jgi:hypothetical protein
LPPRYWIAGDAAYACTEYLLTPYSKAALLLPGFETCRDAYNFYQSSHRVHIEQAFGMLVRRFGIFWRPLGFDLPRCGVIVGVAMRLHNWCIDHNAKIPQETRETRASNKEAFSRWWDNATSLREDAGARQGQRSDLQPNSALRDALTEHLAAIGAIRPLRQ